MSIFAAATTDRAALLRALRPFTAEQVLCVVGWQDAVATALFDVLAAESDHYNLRVQYVNALHDGQQMNAVLTSLGTGLSDWLK